MKHTRNNHLYDPWSLVHLGSGVLAGWIMPPFIALSVLVLWELLEVLVLSPLLGRVGIVFGHETLRNVLSDIIFDFVGLLLGLFVLTQLISPPFYLFG